MIEAQHTQSLIGDRLCGTSGSGISGGDVKSVARAGHGTPYPSSTSRVTARSGAAIAERRINRAGLAIDRHHAAFLNWIVAMVADADVDVILVIERRRVAHLFVKVRRAGTC